MACVLVIDDESLVCDVMKELIEAEGHEVLMAENGEDGLRICREQRVDVVVTDLHMPVLDGLETIKALQGEEHAPQLIAMSGAGTFMVETNLESSRLHGAVRTFLKPFDHRELIEAIDELVAEKIA